MLKTEEFISQEMMIAPEHPLANNLDLPLPDSAQASITEIHTVQQRDRIPGVVKRLIPLDNNTYWEYWWCVPGRILLAEDVELLRSDRPRVEAILAKLIWLWGGRCFGEQTSLRSESEPTYDWQQVLVFVHQQGMKPDVLDVDFLPLTIQRNNQKVAVEPNHWHIEFFQLQPVADGFELQEPKNVCSCQIWTGKPLLKDLETGETITRYDLWVSRPLDVTNPPWRSPLAANEV